MMLIPHFSALIRGIGEGERLDRNRGEVRHGLPAGEPDATRREMTQNELDGSHCPFLDGGCRGDPDAVPSLQDMDLTRAGDQHLLPSRDELRRANHKAAFHLTLKEAPGMQRVGVLVRSRGDDLDRNVETKQLQNRILAVEAPELDARQAPEIHPEAGPGLQPLVGFGGRRRLRNSGNAER